jgi:hypothetical protein
MAYRCEYDSYDYELGQLRIFANSDKAEGVTDKAITGIIHEDVTDRGRVRATYTSTFVDITVSVSYLKGFIKIVSVDNPTFRVVLQISFRELRLIKAELHSVANRKSFNLTTGVDSHDIVVSQSDLVDGNHGGLLAIPYIINLH